MDDYKSDENLTNEDTEQHPFERLISDSENQIVEIKDEEYKGAADRSKVARNSFRFVNIALIVSLISLAGVVFLLASQGFSFKKAPVKPKQIVSSTGEPTTGTRVAFVRDDSIQNNYLMTIYFLDSIERRFKSMENDLVEKKKGYQKKIENYYRDVQSGLLKESAAMQIEQKLEEEGRNIASLEESYASRISDMQYQLNTIYFDSLWNFLERTKKAIGFDMVLGYQHGLTNIFFADESLDITLQVIDLMNQEYAAKYPNRKKISKKN